MNPEIKRRWIERLRSGQYRQGKNLLHNPGDDTYCCLGVLCEIAVEDGVITKNGERLGTVFGDSTTFLSSAVLQWADLNPAYPGVAITDPESSNSSLTSLAYMNDDRGLDFNEIADIIEEQL